MLRRQYPAGDFGNELVDAISHELSRSGIYVSDADVQENVDELENHLNGFDIHGLRTLINRLKDKLAMDKESDGSQGLYRSRRQFLIFCHAARVIRSVELAEALSRFLESKADDIDDEEKDFLVTEWCHGLLQLKGLIDEDTWYRALQKVAKRGPPLFEEWRRPGPQRSWIEELARLLQDRVFNDHGRGRHQLQRYDFPARRLSVPARRPSLIDLPRGPRTGYNSPLLSPMHGVLDALHERQYVQQCNTWRLEQRIDRLRYR